MNSIIDAINREIAIHCLSKEGGAEQIEKEIRLLKKQEFQIVAERMVQYAAVKKEKDARKARLFVHQVGFIGGGVQTFTGLGVCAASSGTTCAAWGTPLIAHGLNNFYESGYYLLYRKIKKGYTGDIYREMARRLGYSADEADIVYSTVDIALSGYGLARKAVRQETFKLFRHINSDFIRGWQQMGTVPLFTEGLTDVNTLFSIWQLKEEKNVQ